MDSVKPKSSTVSGVVQNFTKVLRLRAAGVAPKDGIIKVKYPEIINTDPPKDYQYSDDDEKLQQREAMEALLARLFASISAIKAAYAQLQIAQFPYNPESIQSADKAVVSELKSISELKHCYLKKQILPSRESQTFAEIQEQKNLLKTFEIMAKKLQSQLQLKEAEIVFLQDKLLESQKLNRSLETRLNHNSCIYALNNLHFSALNPGHFITVLHHASKSIRTFVKLMMEEMASAGWDLDAAASAIVPGSVFTKSDHRAFAFESYVCRKMFSDFQFSSFSQHSSKLKRQKRKFFDSFMKLKSIIPLEHIVENPESKVAKFCRQKYLSLVHPRMESALFGSRAHRGQVNWGGFPCSPFSTAFLEMAKRVWLLHRLGFSFDPEASIFQVRPGTRFSEVYMESVCDESQGLRPAVGFTVSPGFRVGKTVIQCKVYLQSASDEG